MYPHEKPGYVDACRAAGVCQHVLWVPGKEPLYCDMEHTVTGPYTHYAIREDASYEYWYDEDCAPLEGGS